MFNSIGALDSPDFSSSLLAEVVDNRDPLQRQRVRVRIPNLVDGETTTLPWCLPVHPTWLGHSANSMQVCVPEVGSVIRVIIEDGSLAYCQADGSTPVGSFSLPTELSTNYPARRGYKDSANTIHYIDTTAGSAEWYIQVAGGAYISIKNGSTDIYVANGKIHGTSLEIDAPTTFKQSVEFSSAITNGGVSIGAGHKHNTPSHGGLSSSVVPGV
jgi:Type VI secretion system/phage-baseplate injector OB domain